MTDIFKLLGEVDSDGAVHETAETVAGDTRGGFLKKAGIGAGAIVAGSAFAGALPSFASAGTIPASDIAILNFALTLEYLEAAFYAEAVAAGKLTGETARFASVVAQHEGVHVTFLKKVLGSKAVAKPKFDFKGTTGTQSTFQATAEVLEYTGVAAYLGQVGNIKSKAILGAAGSILPIEAYHAAWIADIRRHGVKPYPAPVAFAKGKTKAQILAAVKATGFIVGETATAQTRSRQTSQTTAPGRRGHETSSRRPGAAHACSGNGIKPAGIQAQAYTTPRAAHAAEFTVKGGGGRSCRQ